jgi:class 3 adenylate cyclase
VTKKRVERQLATILCAKLTDYPRLPNADEKALAAFETYRRELIDPLIAQNHARSVKTTGDSILIEFPSVVDAVWCAVLLQQGDDAGLPAERRVRLRISIGCGDSIADDGDIFGDSASVAVRLQALAEPGEICVSASVREQVGQDLPIGFVDLGERDLGNVGRPIHVYRIAPWPRRHEKKRQRVEAALRGFVARYKLPPDAVQRLSDAIYKLYRQHAIHKSLDEHERRFDAGFRRNVRALARRRANSPGPDAREYGAHMARLDTLDRRKVGRQKAVEGASAASWDDLSATEKRRARERLCKNVLPGSKVRQSAPEVEYLREVAALLEREIGRKIPFSSSPPAIKRPNNRGGRHYGPAFDVMMAAAEMADCRLTNEQWLG